MNLWLITWEWTGDAAAVEDKVACVLSGDLSAQEVSLIVDTIYRLHSSTLNELVSLAEGGRNPYPPQLNPNPNGSITISCGHHPWLQARLVRELRVSRLQPEGLETLTWEEMVASGEWIRKNIVRQTSGPLSQRLTWDRAKGKHT